MCLGLNVLCAKHKIIYTFERVYVFSEFILKERTSDDNVSRQESIDYDL